MTTVEPSPSPSESPRLPDAPASSASDPRGEQAPPAREEARPAQEEARNASEEARRASDEARPASEARLRGVCRLLVAGVLAERIDRPLAEGLVGAPRYHARPRHKLPQRRPGVGNSPPLRWSISAPTLRISAAVSAPRVEVALFDTGACVLTWSLPFELGRAGLIDLSAQAYEHRDLLATSRRLLAEIAETLRPALVGRPPIADAPTEDYVLFELPEPRSAAVRALLADRATLARILRAERGPLSESEINDATDRPVSYAPGEGCWVDWLGAVLVGEDLADERFVLEAATVELLELRHLERALMRDLRLAERELQGAVTRRAILSRRSAELARIARRQVRDALTHEGVDNALGMLGDDYLARLYRRAAERFHLTDWDVSIQRKLGVLDGIHAKLSDASAQRRSELLEWIIIVLIAVDIVLWFASKGHT